MYIGIITVRTSSSRLPEKCLLPFGDGMNVIAHVIRRAVAFGITPIVCTSVDASDDILEQIAQKEGVNCFRGSLVNKLKRWSDCADHFNLEYFHTIDADDPFFDPDEVKASIDLLLSGNYDMVCPSEISSAGSASVGYSLKADIIKQALVSVKDDADTEMMWYYMDKVENLRKTVLPSLSEFDHQLRLTLDFAEDYWLLESVRRIVGNFATRREVDELFKRNPDFYQINWFRNHEWKSAQLSKQI